MINDTIVALSTAPLESALGVIRISGDKSFKVLESIFSRKVELKTNKFNNLMLFKLSGTFLKKKSISFRKRSIWGANFKST